jgi:hypothetical protein
MINVSNIEDLYLAVNDPANVGETIGMAPANVCAQQLMLPVERHAQTALTACICKKTCR